MYDSRGKTILITGGSSAIGAVIAEELTSRGAHLTLVARREDRLRGEAAIHGIGDDLSADATRFAPHPITVRVTGTPMRPRSRPADPART